jgi:hypothetical protein
MSRVYFRVQESSGGWRTMVAESHTPSPLSPLIHAKVAIPLAAFVFLEAF